MLTAVNHNKRQLRKTLQKAVWFFAIAFISMNIVAYIHAYTFTHFTGRSVIKTRDARETFCC
jgi:hypothetical protein